MKGTVRFMAAVALMLAFGESAALVVGTSAFAQTQQQIDWCKWKGDATPDRVMEGCTAIIQSGRWSGTRLAEVYSERGNRFLNKGDYAHAIADFTEAIKLWPRYILAIMNRGTANFKNGDYENAIADFDQAIRVDPKFANAFYNRGVVKLKKGDTTGGNADIARAKQLDPGSYGNK